MDPLIFEPCLRPVVWGGRRLGEMLGKPLPTREAYGESWEISPHAKHDSRVAEGPFAGLTLNKLCRAQPREIFGPQAVSPAQFPLLIKLLDCHSLLSIQVHPDDERARTLAGEEFGKTEAWIVLHADPDARIYAGFRPGVRREDVEQHLAAGTLKQLLHELIPRPGDCLLLPAGTVHAVGGGVLMAEVQQASDATFRLFDYNRVGPDGQPRELHIEQALAVIDWQAGPVNPVAPRPLSGGEPGIHREELVACQQFGIERLRLSAPFDVETRTGAEVWLVLQGRAQLRTGSGYSRQFNRGETVLIPAATRGPRWTPGGDSATLLRVSLPH